MTEPQLSANEPTWPAFVSPAASDLPVRTPDQELANDASHLPAENSNEPELYEYVRLPDGKVRAILKTDIQEVPETATQALPKTAMVAIMDPHFYVWLADGNVIRVKQSDLPAPAGSNAQFGHWQINDKVYLIVNVVPVEDNVKGDQ